MDWEAFYNAFRKPGFIPGYEIQNRLGGGAFGDVYKARKTSIGKAYAIKFLKLEDEAQREAVERELAQVRHFAAIDHPNLVTIEDLGVVLDVPFLVMGYAGEDTLARRLKGGPLPCDEALLVFVQAARGVLALHDRRLVHFDLKPSNIFLKGDVARVGDYGLSKLLEGGRMTLSIGRGTPQYMAPEILRSRADHRADIYSLGVILYESLTGELPYKAEQGGALVLRESDEPPKFAPGCEVPARVRDVICRCLRIEPADRYQEVGDLLAELGQTARLGESVAFMPGAAPELLAEDLDERGAAAARRGDGPEFETPRKPRAPSAALAAALAAERSGERDGQHGAHGQRGQHGQHGQHGRGHGAAVDDSSDASGAGDERDLAYANHGAPRDAGARARALVRGLADFHGEPAAGAPEIAPPAPRSLQAGPVPVPPRVRGGLVGNALATARIGVEVLLALLAGLARAALVGWRTLVDRLLRRKGNALGRAGRLALFLLVMAGVGFVATLLGMVGLLLLEQAQQAT